MDAWTVWSVPAKSAWLVSSCRNRTQRMLEKDASNLILKKKNPLLVYRKVTVAGIHACRRRHSEKTTPHTWKKSALH